MNFGNDTQEIKSWIENDNTAYRLGDAILHAGKFFDDLKSCILELHDNTLAAKYLQHSEYKANPLIAKSPNKNMKLFNEILLQHCSEVNISNQRTSIKQVLVHIRLGDGVYGRQKAALLRSPFSLRCYKQFLGHFNSSKYSIGLIYNNTSSSIFSKSGTDTNESSTRVIQYLQGLKLMFPNAYDYKPQASPDEHFCAMINAPVFVAGKGTYQIFTHLQDLLFPQLVHLLLL
jgi:hypothetical protein